MTLGSGFFVSKKAKKAMKAKGPPLKSLCSNKISLL